MKALATTLSYARIPVTLPPAKEALQSELELDSASFGVMCSDATSWPGADCWSGTTMLGMVAMT